MQTSFIYGMVLISIVFSIIHALFAVAGKNNKGMERINQVIFLVSEQNKTIKQNLYYSELNKPSKTNFHFQVDEHNGKENGNCSHCGLLLFPPPKSFASFIPCHS